MTANEVLESALPSPGVQIECQLHGARAAEFKSRRSDPIKLENRLILISDLQAQAA